MKLKRKIEVFALVVSIKYLWDPLALKVQLGFYNGSFSVYKVNILETSNKSNQIKFLLYSLNTLSSVTSWRGHCRVTAPGHNPQCNAAPVASWWRLVRNLTDPGIEPASPTLVGWWSQTLTTTPNNHLVWCSG